MNINLNETLESLNKKLDTPEIAPDDLYKAYDIVLRLRNQLLGVIYEEETFVKTSEHRLAYSLTEGVTTKNAIILTIYEPLPSMKEITPDIQDHWLELIHTAMEKSAGNGPCVLSSFEKAFVWIEITMPKRFKRSRLWDTSNRAINLVINNLKGPYFEDDNLEHMAFGVVGMWGEKGVKKIHIMDQNILQQINGISS